MIKKGLFFILVLACVSTLLQAGTTGKIVGTVKDAQTGEPLPGANIILEGTRLGAASDETGKYLIMNIPPGNYQLKASMMGYAKVTQTNVRVKIDQTTVVDYQLSPEVLETGEIIIVADRPVVELDLTASKETITADEFENSWVNSVAEAVEIQSGVNIHGGVRGGFGMDVTYLVDGMEIRDGGSNSSFVAANTSAIQTMEILTGGYNAEYGRANGAIVNIVTKSGTDRWHGSAKFRYRPAGKYHWGRNIYSQDNFEWQTITQEYFEENGGGERWNAYWTEVLGEPPSPEFNWQKYQEIMTPNETLRNYADRAQWEIEGTAYGPLTSKLNLMLSGRFLNRVNKYPSVLAYNPEWNMMAKFNYVLSDNTNLKITGIYQGTDNTGTPRLAYGSSEDLVEQSGQTLPSEIKSAYDPNKWFPGGAKFIFKNSIYPPQYIRNYSFQAKLTHVFSSNTFLEVALSHFNLSQEVNYRKENLWYLRHEDWIMSHADPDYLPPYWFDNPPTSLVPIQQPGDLITFDSWSWNTTLKVDFTSQFHPNHLIKTGLEISPQFSKNVNHAAGERNIVINDWMDPGFYPWEAAAYVQDKIEVKGMVINAGVRLDLFNANKKANYTIWDPAGISDITEGNQGIGIISFDPDGPNAKQTPTQVAVSPRIGISHPITETTVLHFMYGHFNQRPSWQALGALPMMTHIPIDPDWNFPELNNFQADGLYLYNFFTSKTGNPALEYQKMVQYEVGFDQNIADLARLDITMYYKAGKNLTSVGFKQGTEDFGTTARLVTNMWPDPYNHLGNVSGENVSRFFIPLNGGRLDARGLEFTLETMFMRHAKIRAVYNMSWSSTGTYGPQMAMVPRPQHNNTKVEPDQYYGGEENQNERWNPTHTLRLNANLSTPGSFGPALAAFHPLGNWDLNIFYQYASPERFTYHSVVEGDFSSEPDNREWKAHHKTNLRLSKGVSIASGVQMILSLDVINLFNNKVLRLLPEGSDELTQYMENGTLPQIKATYQKKNPETGKWETGEWVETDEWSIYSPDLMPREIFFGVGFEF